MLQRRLRRRRQPPAVLDGRHRRARLAARRRPRRRLRPRRRVLPAGRLGAASPAASASSCCCCSCPRASAASSTRCATAYLRWVASRRGIVVPSLVADRLTSVRRADARARRGAAGGRPSSQAGGRATVAARGSSAVEVAGRPAVRRPARKGPWYRRLDPRQVTGGAPLFPLVVLFGLNAVDELDRTAFGVLTPEIRDAFGLSLAGVAMLTVGRPPRRPSSSSCRSPTSPTAATAPAWPPSAPLMWAVFTRADRRRRRSSPACTLLYIARGGSALGKTFNATHNSLLADYYPQESRARVFYAHRLANSVGQFVGPLVAGRPRRGVHRGSRRSSSSPCPTVVFVFLALRLREPTRGVHERRRRRRRRGHGGDRGGAPPASPRRSASCSPRQSARRIYFSLPFLTASVLGLGTFLEPLLRGGLRRRLGRARRDLRHDRAGPDRRPPRRRGRRCSGS